MADYFRNNPGCKVLVGLCRVIDEEGRKLRTNYLPAISTTGLVKMRTSSILPQPSTFLSQEVLHSIGFFDTKYNYAADYEYALRLASRYQICQVNRELTAFRRHEGALSSRVNVMGESAEIAALYASKLKVSESFGWFFWGLYYVFQLYPRNWVSIASDLYRRTIRAAYNDKKR